MSNSIEVKATKLVKYVFSAYFHDSISGSGEWVVLGQFTPSGRFNWSLERVKWPGNGMCPDLVVKELDKIGEIMFNEPAKIQVDYFALGYIRAKTGEILGRKDLIDLDLVGDESQQKLEGILNDYISECDSERAESKSDRRYREEAYEEEEAYNREMWG